MIKQHRNVVEQQGNGITLINNKDVMKYVRHIYSFYNILDPLQKNKDLNSTKKKINFTSTNKKMRYNIGEETIDTARTINSARTNRSNEGKIDVEKICVSPFFCHQKSQDRTERTHRKVIVLKSKLKINKQISNDLSNEKSWKAIDKQANEYRNMNTIATKDLPQTKSQISPQFRYCFMCQQPILDYNLQFHEDQCYQLQRAYTFTLKQLINILDKKILRLIDEVNDNYIMISNEQIVNQHTKNKQILQKWIVQVKQSFNKKEQDIFDKNNKILEDVYKNDIESKILKKTGCKLEVINKLNWFLRLKDNVQRKYYNQN